MQLTELRDLLQDYPLNAFVGTPKTMSFNAKQLSEDAEIALSGLAKTYLSNLSDLIAHRDMFFSNEVMAFRDYISMLIESTKALREIVQLGEDMTTIFDNEINWTRALAMRSIIIILDKTAQELTVIRNQLKGPRFINRARDKTYFVIWQKIPQILNILSTMIAIELGLCNSSEIVDAIGKGIILTEIC